ncbi:CPBP family intramembrane glutamic endopeptidase [Psychroserpens sp.]|uniref:CPBP family intramembrane glutamic endopeptidase n=1 Tax=Psychroserpens sp. TaxID=2020870 RepID=UPI0038597087
MKSTLTKYLVEFSSLKLTRPISDKVRWLEIIGVVLTALGKFIVMDFLNWRLPFVIVAILSWSIYVCYRYKKDQLVLKDWGFRLDNFKAVFKMMMPFTALSVFSFFIIGYVQGTINLSWHILPLLITYPIWGTIQQFLTIGLIAGNLNTLRHVKLSKISVILITAVLFSLVHYPINWLMIGTFVLGLVYGYIYLKSKNLYVLGLLHGWLGALFYYTVVNQDPFADVFLKWFN